MAAPAVLDVLRVRNAVAELHDRGVALALGARASDRARQLRDPPSDLPRDALGDPLEFVGVSASSMRSKIAAEPRRQLGVAEHVDLDAISLSRCS